VVATPHCIVDMDTGVDTKHRDPDRTLGMEVKRDEPRGQHRPRSTVRMKETAGWDGMDGQRKESWAVGGHLADIYRFWSTRPEPGREGLAPAPGKHRDDTEVRLKGHDPSWHRGREDHNAISRPP